MWDGFIDPIASVFGQDADSQRDNLRTDASGKYKPTFGDRFWGRADEGQGVLDAKKEKETRDLVQSKLELAGGQYVEGMTVGEAGAEIRRLNEERERQSNITAASDAYYSPEAIYERKQTALARADEKELRADQLELQRMQYDREDQRYNERMEREDRARRRESIQSLATGLAALGAAFAM